MRIHRTDLVSFAFGLLFLALAAWWLLAQLLGLVLPPVGWFLAGGLILVGGLGLIGALRASWHAGKPEPSGPMPATDPAGPDPTSAPWPGPATDDHTLDLLTADDRTDLAAGDETRPPGQRGPAA